MSVYWGYVCTSHNPELISDRWYNHGEKQLEYVWERRDRLVTLAAMDLEGPWTAVELGWSSAARWLLEHPRCVVELRDEYGNRLPLPIQDTADE